jgi:glycerol-3-phosphate acyltransferase PlsY
MWYFSSDIWLSYATVFIMLLLIYRHSSNIKKLLAGQESKIGKKAQSDPLKLRGKIH